MKINDLITKKNVKLYSEITNLIKIDFFEGDDLSWKCRLRKNIFEICYKTGFSKYPEESFVHELLHGWCYLNGYPQINYINTISDGFETKDLIEHLENELAHHKMFPKYLSLGYNAIGFIEDCSSQDYYEYLNVNLNSKNPTYLDIVGNYISLISPNMESIFSGQKAFIKLARSRKSKMPQVLDSIDKEIEFWKNKNSFDPKNTIQNIILSIPNCANANIELKYNIDEKVIVVNLKE